MQANPRGSRAVSADGSAVTLRTQENPENGDLAFWEQAVRGRLTDVRGYKLAARKETSFGRLKGVEMSFDYEKTGVNYAYVVLLCVDGRKVRSVLRSYWPPVTNPSAERMRILNA